MSTATVSSITSRFRHRLRTWRALNRASRSWPASDLSARSKTEHGAAPVPISKLLLIPADFVTLIGARGDEAMLRSISTYLSRRHSNVEIFILTGSDQADSAALGLGFQPIRLPLDKLDIPALAPVLKRLQPDTAVLVGADMMDGHYSTAHTARLLLLIQTLAVSGTRCVVTGFSFNESPSKDLQSFYDRLDPRVRLSIRDPASYERFSKFSSAPATLVADVAFLLERDHKSERVSSIHRWVFAEKTQGRTVIGVNAHPGLVRSLGGGSVDGLTRRLGESLLSVSATHEVSWLLIPHDYRGEKGDDAVLTPVAKMLLEKGLPHVSHPQEHLSAPELKAVAGALDGVITGRMHLAIAASGCGVPVACLTYQGKFEGLFEHLGLPKRYLMDPKAALQPGELEAMLSDFLRELPRLKLVVEQGLPEIFRKSESNLIHLV